MQHLMHPTYPSLHPGPALSLADPDTSWSPPPYLQGLMKSHERMVKLFTMSTKKIHPAGPDIPEKNIWGRPMPRKRVKNGWRKWYAQAASRLFPPLPEHEYQAVRDIAEGRVQCEAVPRRPLGSVPVFASVQEQEDVADDSLLDNPEAKVKRLWGKPVSARYVQRRMVEVLGHIPRPITSEDDEKPPRFEWRDAKPGSSQVPVLSLTAGQAEAFFGETAAKEDQAAAVQA
jgi:hypothetical protein